MKNKDYLLDLLAIMFMAVVSIGFASCGGDHVDEIENGGNENSSLIQTLKTNKWITRDSSYGEGSDDHAWVDIETSILYFTSDRSGISYWIQKDYDTDLGNTTTKNYSLFEYTVSGNIVILTYEDSYTLTVYYQGGYLTTESMGTIFEPSKMTANDYEFVKSLGPQTNTSNGITYTYDSRTYELKISGKGEMQNYSRSNQPWKDYHIKKVIVGEGITSIGDYAFYHMNNIEEIDLPNSLQKIGKQAFEKTLISEVYFPSHLEIICEEAFAGCEYLKKISFAGGCEALIEIGDNAFLSCPINLSYFTLPKNLKKIGNSAFISSSCSSLTLNDKLESVGNFAFGKINASKIEIPNSVKSIGSQAFRGSFSEIRIGTGLMTIGDIPFVASKSGKMYINLGIPLELSSYQIIIANTNGNNAAGSWTLYVPKGSKSAYQKATGWKSFKSINEDSSLTSGNGMPDNNEQEWIATGTIQGHDYIDLGLPSHTMWATTNIGAEKIEDYGDYFAWGETKGYNGGKKNFNWSTYKHCGGSGSTLRKYCTNNQYGTVDNITKLEPIDDAATVIWGEAWQIPTSDQYDELIDSKYTIIEWTIVNGVNGLKITSKSNKKSIFFPAAGYRSGTSFHYIGEYGRYWSRSLNDYREYQGDNLSFGLAAHSYDQGYSGSLNINGGKRCDGHSIRPTWKF